MATNKKASGLHLRPKKGESADAFTKRFTDAWIAWEQKYRRDNKLPPLKDDRKKV
jgi:hypothetical protein